MAVIQVRVAVKRRTAGIGTVTSDDVTDDPRSLHYASKVAAQRLIDYTTRTIPPKTPERQDCAAAWSRPGS